MKANEAPKKIFLEREKETNRIHHLWGRTPVVSSFYEHIEYTRTDAFIEKACEWLSKHFYDECYQFYDNDGMWIDADSMLEDFKNYMKGE